MHSEVVRRFAFGFTAFAGKWLEFILSFVTSSVDTCRDILTFCTVIELSLARHGIY